MNTAILAAGGAAPKDRPDLQARVEDAPLVHSPFGGSVAARVLRCSASVRLVEKVPEYQRKRSSAYAERGSALHVAMARLIEREVSLDGLVGETIDHYAITRADVEDMLRPALAVVEPLLDTPGAEYYLEHRVVFPTVEGAFGTTDLIIRVYNDLYLIDFKFGSGVRVLALCPEGDDDVLNPQLAFYAAAARHSLPDFSAGLECITLVIVQPQAIEENAGWVSSAEVTHDELDAFVLAYRAACEEALGPAPRLARGPHCRFCAAKPICPLHTAPLLDLAQFDLPPNAFGAPSKAAYLQVLANGLNLVDAIADIRKELHDQAKRALEAGDDVPGYALTKGRAVRAWADENAAPAALVSLGLERADVLEEVVRSVKQVELRARARGLKIPKEFIVSSPSGVSLCRAENARTPPPGRSELARSFAEALQAFQEGGNS